MELGGKTMQTNSPHSPQEPGSSMASSELSDEDGELSLKVMLPSGEYRESCFPFGFLDRGFNVRTSGGKQQV